MMPMQIQVSWGEALAARSRKVRGGMKGIAAAARMIAGPATGSRTTFLNLCDLEGPPDRPNDRFRAWLVLAALDELPEDWGLSDSDVPQGFDAKDLREQVVSALPWIHESAGSATRAA